MKKHQCFTLKVEGAEVRVQGDPAMEPRAFDALRSVIRAAVSKLEKLQPPVAPVSVELSDAQADALIRMAVEKQAYPMRRTKLATWTVLCNAGLLRCVNHDPVVTPGTLMEITEQGFTRALHERVKRNARKRVKDD
jgi:hypothetical protein